MENPIKMDVFGVPLFLETPISFATTKHQNSPTSNETRPHNGETFFIYQGRSPRREGWGKGEKGERGMVDVALKGLLLNLPR